jgi:prolyl-tRNA editing enzyme YbaK/EbsC (Cys-tRNA(Pro) deacylase)
MDRTIAEDEHIEFRAGTHTDTIGIAYADFARLVSSKIIDVARHL